MTTTVAVDATDPSRGGAVASPDVARRGISAKHKPPKSENQDEDGNNSDRIM